MINIMLEAFFKSREKDGEKKKTAWIWAQYRTKLIISSSDVQIRKEKMHKKANPKKIPRISCM